VRELRGGDLVQSQLVEAEAVDGKVALLEGGLVFGF
jgi:hypothetical protein